MQYRNRLPSPRIATAVAIVALAASGATFAGGGEALDIELPSMRSPVSAASSVVQSREEVALASSNAFASAAFGGALTREQVREQLKQARADGTMSMHGEAGDTATVLAAREAFNVAQSEAIMAAYMAEQERSVALAAAELRRSEIETEGQLAVSGSASEREMPLAGGAVAADRDATEVRIDVIDLQSSAKTPSATELVIVSLDGGDAASQQARAMHVRRQLAAMGLAQGQIYVESTGAEGDVATAPAAEGDMDVAAFADGEVMALTAADSDDN